MIAVAFPAFTDGQASVLRVSCVVKGIPVSCVQGDVTRDRLAYLERCGFDALEVPEDRYKEKGRRF